MRTGVHRQRFEMNCIDEQRADCDEVDGDPSMRSHHSLSSSEPPRQQDKSS
jgi:hypothetical protein